MAIKLDEDYRLEKDIASWNLCYRHVGEISEKTGKPKISTDISYHPNIRVAIQKYCDEKLGRCDSVKELIESVDAQNIHFGKVEWDLMVLIAEWEHETGNETFIRSATETLKMIVEENRQLREVKK